MQQPNTITIVSICDNHYAILLCALVKSIEINHISEELIEFLIVEDGISLTNKSKIETSIKNPNLSVKWLPIKNCIPSSFRIPKDKSSLPKNVYARLFIPSFIRKEVTQVIYLDVDMIINEDVSKLWNINFGTNIVAAVQDQFVKIVSRWGGVSNYEEFQISPDNKYFNSGLMIINLEKWRNAEVTDKVIRCIHENREHTKFPDQYGLNAILFNEWFELDPLWNRFAYSEDEKPYLIHFTGRKPIYRTYKFSEKYKDMFFSYLRQTEWKNFQPIGESKRYFKIATNIIGRYIKL